LSHIVLIALRVLTLQNQIQEPAAPALRPVLNRVNTRSPSMPLPIPTIVSPGRRVFFAFDVISEWIQEYAKTHWNDFYKSEDMTYERYEPEIRVIAGMNILKAATGIRNLELKWSVPNENSIRNNTTIPGPGPDNPLSVLLVSVCSSRRSPDFI